jgi:hypothetical protein
MNDYITREIEFVRAIDDLYAVFASVDAPSYLGEDPAPTPFKGSSLAGAPKSCGFWGWGGAFGWGVGVGEKGGFR